MVGLGVSRKGFAKGAFRTTTQTRLTQLQVWPHVRQTWKCSHSAIRTLGPSLEGDVIIVKRVQAFGAGWLRPEMVYLSHREPAGCPPRSRRKMDELSQSSGAKA